MRNLFERFVFSVRDRLREIFKGRGATIEGQQQIQKQKQQATQEQQVPSPPPQTQPPSVPAMRDRIVSAPPTPPSSQPVARQEPQVDFGEPAREGFGLLGKLGRGVFKVFGGAGKEAGTTAVVGTSGLISGLPGKILGGIFGKGAAVKTTIRAATASPAGLTSGAIVALIGVFVAVFIFVVIGPTIPGGVGTFSGGSSISSGEVPSDYVPPTAPPSSLTFSWPIRQTPQCSQGSPFGYGQLRGIDRFHYGIDMPANIGELVYPIAKGKVYRVPPFDGPGYGHYVIVQHSENLFSLYAHFFGAPFVRPNNEEIDIDTPLGVVGVSGNTTGPHLHLEIAAREVDFNTLNVFIPCDYLVEQCAPILDVCVNVPGR